MLTFNCIIHIISLSKGPWVIFCSFPFHDTPLIASLLWIYEERFASDVSVKQLLPHRDLWKFDDEYTYCWTTWSLYFSNSSSTLLSQSRAGCHRGYASKKGGSQPLAPESLHIMRFQTNNFLCWKADDSMGSDYGTENFAIISRKHVGLWPRIHLGEAKIRLAWN